MTVEINKILFSTEKPLILIRIILILDKLFIQFSQLYSGYILEKGVIEVLLLLLISITNTNKGHIVPADIYVSLKL